MASASILSGKLNLRSTSKISLSDRFKLVRQKALINRNLATNRGKVLGPVQAQISKRNRILAQQMANKPSVLAALKIKKRSIKQRLGKVQPRLGLTNLNRPFANKSTNNQNQVASNNGNRFRLNRSNFVGTNRVSSTSQRGRRRNAKKAGNMSNIGNANKGQFRLNRNNENRARAQARFMAKNGNRFGNKLQTGEQNKGQGRMMLRAKNRNRNDGNQRRNNRGNRKRNQTNQRRRGGNFQNRGFNAAGGLRWQRRKNLDKSQLDKDLDEYMAKTKTQLDADLDAYMARA